MPVHSLIVINENGNIVFSKYFLASENGNNSDRLLFEQALHTHTSKLWKNKAIIMQHKQVVTINDDIYVVFQRFQDLIVFASGMDDMDEISLSEVIDCTGKLLKELLGKEGTEKDFLNPENYGKWVLSVDEMMPQGIVETLDVEHIAKLSKMKNL